MNEPIFVSQSAITIAQKLDALDAPEDVKIMCPSCAIEVFKRSKEQPGRTPEELLREYIWDEYNLTAGAGANLFYRARSEKSTEA